MKKDSLEKKGKKEKAAENERKAPGSVMRAERKKFTQRPSGKNVLKEENRIEWKFPKEMLVGEKLEDVEIDLVEEEKDEDQDGVEKDKTRPLKAFDGKK